MSAPTNILFLPVVIMNIETTTNADWLDGLEYWSDVPPDGTPIDLTGITFDLEMRSSPPVATVVLHASTYNGLIRVYANSWQLLVPSTTMVLIPPGDYVFDLIGRADDYTRNLVQATVRVDLGITRTDLPGATSTPESVQVMSIADGMPYAQPGTTVGPVP
jgi:hypothetical protein